MASETIIELVETGNRTANKSLKRIKIVAEILKCLKNWYFKDEGVKPRINTNMTRPGKRCTVHGAFTGGSVGSAGPCSRATEEPVCWDLQHKHPVQPQHLPQVVDPCRCGHEGSFTSTLRLGAHSPRRVRAWRESFREQSHGLDRRRARLSRRFGHF